MARGSLQMAFSDRVNPLASFMKKNAEIRTHTKVPFAPQLFGNAGREHMEKYGTKKEHFAKVAYKNHLHSVNNPYSQFRTKYSLDEIKKSATIHEPLTKLQCCPTSNGAGCAIIVSEKFMKDHHLEDHAVEVLHCAMTTDKENTFSSNSSIKLVGADLTKNAAKQVYEVTGIGPEKVDVCELHDCFSANELITYEGLGLCPEGEAGKYIDKDAFTYGGQTVVNPSGGLISKGHPLGATGLAQCSELCWQLRGMADKRQVEDAKIALQHNLGLGGACIVTMYKKYNDKPGKARKDQTSDPDILALDEKDDKPRYMAKM
jgi:sterol carrier protein 2